MTDDDIDDGQRDAVGGNHTAQGGGAADRFTGNGANPVGAQPLGGAQLARAALDAARAAGRTYTTRPGGPKKRPADDGQSPKRRRWSGSGPDPRDPQPLGRLVSRMVADRGWDKPTAEARVLGDWPKLVGPEIASKSRPVQLKDGELTLQAESTAWATQLRLLSTKMLGLLSAEVGPNVVKKIRVHGPAAPSWKRGPISVRGRGPRDTYG
nr:DciA family protein [Cryptosporangium phraense]